MTTTTAAVRTRQMPLTRFAFAFGLAIIVLLAAVPRAISYDFSLPYIDHPDEPNYYLAGLEARGLYDNRGYYEGVPPLYIWLHTGAQIGLEAVGVSGLSATTAWMRVLSAAANLLTLVVIALTARRVVLPLSRAAADAAGWVAGAAWGVAPLVVENGVYALPDPLVYLFTALALWLAVLAITETPRAGRWAVLSVAAALAAVLLKYPALPALIPGGAAGLFLLARNRKHGTRVIALQAVLVAAVGWWLVFGYGIVFQREGALVRDQGVGNLLDMGRLLNNLAYTVIPLNGLAFAITSLTGAAAWVIAARRGLARVPVTFVVMALGVIVFTAWITAAYEVVVQDSIRYVLPATAAACALLGAAVGQIAGLLSLRRAALAPLVALPLVLLVWSPQWDASWTLAQERDRPDTRVVLHRWFDENLEPGTVLVFREHEKTFNPDWGGLRLCCGRWVDWVETGDITERPITAWREAGIRYALIPDEQYQAMQQTNAGRAYLAGALPLRTFASGAMRGPGTTVLQLERMAHETDLRFGEAIHLIGYDVEGEPDAPVFRFYWRADQQPAANYSLFLHVIDAETGERMAQVDVPPAAPQRLTLTWTDANETLISPPIPVEVPTGAYQVMLGLYDYTTGARLPISGDGAPVVPYAGGDAVEIVSG